MRLYVLLALALVLAGCSSFSEEQKTTLLEYFKQQLDAGSISKLQYEALVSAIGGTGFDFNEILKAIGTGLGTLVTGFLGINLWRGSPKARKGNMPTGVK